MRERCEACALSTICDGRCAKTGGAVDDASGSVFGDLDERKKYKNTRFTILRKFDIIFGVVGERFLGGSNERKTR